VFWIDPSAARTPVGRVIVADETRDGSAPAEHRSKRIGKVTDNTESHGLTAFLFLLLFFLIRVCPRKSVTDLIRAIPCSGLIRPPRARCGTRHRRG
jgi:hypothetical protein